MMTAMNTSSRHIASVTPAIIGFGRRCPRNLSGIATDRRQQDDRDDTQPHIDGEPGDGKRRVPHS